MGTYAVYTRVRCFMNNEPCEKEIVVMNVESTSNGGAEHEILDIHYSINNALAFDMSNPVDLINYMKNATVYDIKDFRRRYLAMVEHHNSVISSQYSIIDGYAEDISNKQKEIIKLQRKIAKLTAEIENDRTNIEMEKDYLKYYCDSIRMRTERVDDTVYGLA